MSVRGHIISSWELSCRGKKGCYRSCCSASVRALSRQIFAKHSRARRAQGSQSYTLRITLSTPFPISPTPSSSILYPPAPLRGVSRLCWFEPRFAIVVMGTGSAADGAGAEVCSGRAGMSALRE